MHAATSSALTCTIGTSKPFARSEAQQQQVWDELTSLHQELKAAIKAADDAGTPDQQTGEYTLDRSPSPEV
ncbi:MAG TPA: hypothetical protein VHT25_04380, partial [Solirubrobacteraceae bacterium]|nr:hypothetical protein [Solirubrobacteraceae bacterium]